MSGRNPSLSWSNSPCGGLSLGLSILSCLVACGGPAKPARSSYGQSTTAKTTASSTATATAITVIEAPTSDASAGASVTIPATVPASTIAIQEGTTVVNDITSTLLGIGSEVVAVGPSVNIQQKADLSTSESGQVLISIPYDDSQAALSLEEGKTLAVFYQIKNTAGGKVFGVLPNKKITKTKGKLSFGFLGFGNYQPALAVVSKEEAVSKEVPSAISIDAKTEGLAATSGLQGSWEAECHVVDGERLRTKTVYFGNSLLSKSKVFAEEDQGCTTPMILVEYISTFALGADLATAGAKEFNVTIQQAFATMESDLAIKAKGTLCDAATWKVGERQEITDKICKIPSKSQHVRYAAIKIEAAQHYRTKGGDSVETRDLDLDKGVTFIKK